MYFRKSWFIALIFVVALLGLWRATYGESVAAKRKAPLKTPFENRLYKQLAERRALEDGYKKLSDAVNNLHLNAMTKVEDFTKENEKIKIEWDNLLKKRAKIVDKRYREDGICEMDIAIEVKLIIAELKKLYNLGLHTSKWPHPAILFDDIPKYYAKEFVKVTGFGRPRVAGPSM